MKGAHILAAVAAMLASAACNAEQGSEGSPNLNAPIEAVAAPQGGDWAQTVTKTAEGGFLMGNPNADVKLVEFGSMTCPHCAEFDEKGLQQLIDKYVKTGRVSFEFRNFVRDPFDLTVSLITRCGGPERFFPLTRAAFADQRAWMEQIQSAPQDRLQALSNLPPQQQFVEIAKLGGLQQWAAQRGVPSARSTACLTNENEVNQLVQMNTDATSTYSIPGTPAFLINGKLAENVTTWETLEPKIREALGS